MEALTEIARLPLGHVGNRILGMLELLADVKSTSCTLASPGRPWSPFAPGMPASPFGPCAPGSPFAPGAPVAPVSPFAPGAPASPLAPCAPAGICPDLK